MMVQEIPTHKAAFCIPRVGMRAAKATEMIFREPRAILGTVVATVARRFVPNCSAAIVTKIAQNPTEIPRMNIYQYNMVALAKGRVKYPMKHTALNDKNCNITFLLLLKTWLNHPDRKSPIASPA